MATPAPIANQDNGWIVTSLQAPSMKNVWFALANRLAVETSPASVDHTRHGSSADL